MMTSRGKCNMIFIIIGLLLLFCVHITTSQLPHDLRGDYCSIRQDRCCVNRDDDCSRPILGTLCYCDEFCNRTYNPDCCPDYWTLCLNLPEPSEPVRSSCLINGQYYPFGSLYKDNCNECKCQSSPSNPSIMEFLCERDPCIVDLNLLESLNRISLPWFASNYSTFWGRKLRDGIVYRLGTLEPERGVKTMRPIKMVYDPSSLPLSFDSRDKWGQAIEDVRDQGWCGASWVFSTIQVSGDRLGIQSEGREVARLSAQNLLSCNSRGQQGCTGGHLDRAWGFLRRYGLVRDSCYPYISGDGTPPTTCPYPRRATRNTTLASLGCIPVGRTELYRMQPSYRLSTKIEDIMNEIITYGPVQATMNVPSDFFLYRGGIYRKSGLSDQQRTGYHSVRILGWGEESSYDRSKPLKYWLAANSWGPWWGENGLFKIIRGENECDIESFVLAAWARPALKEYGNGTT